MFCKNCERNLAAICTVCHDAALKDEIASLSLKVLEKIDWVVEDIKQRRITLDKDMGIPEENVNFSPELKAAIDFITEMEKNVKDSAVYYL